MLACTQSGICSSVEFVEIILLSDALNMNGLTPGHLFLLETLDFSSVWLLRKSLIHQYQVLQVISTSSFSPDLMGMSASLWKIARNLF